MEHRNINTVGTIFNDFLGLYTGERPVGIRELIQKYDKHPVLMGLLSNVDSIIYVDVKKAMYEIYPLYKKYRHCALDDEAWKAIYQYAFALAHGAGQDVFYYGDWIRQPGVAICSCNDGLRPVIFKLEATEETSTLSYTPIVRKEDTES